MLLESAFQLFLSEMFIQIGYFFQELYKKIKVGVFSEHSVQYTAIYRYRVCSFSSKLLSILRNDLSFELRDFRICFHQSEFIGCQHS